VGSPLAIREPRSAGVALPLLEDRAPPEGMTMTTPSRPEQTQHALLAQLSGTPLDSHRLQAVLAAYAPILEEIARLRTLDLRDVHPAVIYEPTAPYRSPK